jgi:hypothetical protein
VDASERRHRRATERARHRREAVTSSTLPAGPPHAAAIGQHRLRWRSGRCCSLIRDLGVGQALRDVSEYFELAWGQLVQAGGRFARRGGELLDQASSDRRREQRVAVRDGADTGDELSCREVFEQEAAGSRAQRVVGLLIEVECRQHQNARRVPASARYDLSRGRDAVEFGHSDVHQHDVGRERTSQAHCL